VGPGGVCLGIFGGGVLPAYPNPDPISDQKIPFSKPVFRPGLKNPCTHFRPDYTPISRHGFRELLHY